MKSKLIGVIFLIILSITIFLLFELQSSTETEVIERFQKEQLITTKGLANEIETCLQNETQSVEKLSSLKTLQNNNVNQIADTIQEYFRYLKKDHVKSVSVYDKKGRVIYSTLKDAISLNHNDSKFFKWAMQRENNGKQFITAEVPLVFSLPDKKQTFLVIIATPIYREYNTAGAISRNNHRKKSTYKMVGVVSIVIDAGDILNASLKNNNSSSFNESAWLLDSDGTLLYQPEHPEMALFNIHQQDESCLGCHKSFKYVETILSNTSGTTEYQIKNNQKKLSSFAPIKSQNNSWKLVVNIPFDEVSNFVDTNLNQTLILFAVIVFTFMGAVFFISRSNQSKIRAEEEVKQWKEKHELELKLRESENQYRAIVDSSPNPIFIHSDGKIVFVNPSALSTFGVTDPNEIIGKSILELVHPEDSNLVKERIKKMLESGTPAPVIEERFYRRDGSVLIAEVAPTPVTYHNKPAVQVMVIDITERKRVELQRQIMYEITQGITTTPNLDELLKLIHHSLQKIVYAENIFVALHNQNTGLFSFPYFVDKFDPTPEPLAMGKSCTAFVFRTGKSILLTPELFGQLKAKNEVELVGSPSPSWIGIPLKTPSRTIGVLVLQHYEKENTYTESDVNFLGSVASQIAIIIERKLFEQALRESETNLKVILESTADGILAVDSKGKVIKINKRFVELWNIPQDIINDGDDTTLVNFVLSQLTNPEEFISKVKKLYNSTEEDLDILHFKDGRIFERYSTPLILDDSSIGRVWSFRDVTNRIHSEEEIKKRNEQLSKLNAEKDKFFSIIAHDLRSPFSGFLGLTEIMATGDEDFSKTELTAYSKSMHESASNLFKLIENLLEWAQMQRGSINFAPTVLNLYEMALQGIVTINHKATQKGITIINEISASERVYADEKMIDSVLRNLLSNAVKFTRREGKVIVKAKKIDGGMVEISVSDTGVGIMEKDVKKLFKMEEKVSSEGTEGEPSTGLGLLLCKEFVEKHGGKIWAESEQNVGSTFYFTLHIQNSCRYTRDAMDLL